MATAGSIVIDLVMRTGLFETDTARAEKRLKELQKVAKQAGQVLGTALVAAGTALAVLTKQAIDNADAVRDMGIRLGTSTETLSAFGYAASQTGTDIDTLGRGLKVLAKNAADALNPTSEQAKIFDALGVKVTDTNGKLKDLSVLVPEIADKFAEMADGTTKAALAQALFGKAGLDLTEFLNSGSQGLADFTQRARELGIVIGQDTADAADEFNDKLGDAKALVSGLGLAIAQELLPDLNQMVGGFTDGAGAGEKLKETASGIADGIRAIADVIKFLTPIWTAFVDVVRGLTTNLAAMGDVLGGLVSLDLSRITAGLSGIREGYGLIINGRDQTPEINPGNGRESRGGRRGRVVNIRPTGPAERALQNALGNVPAPKASKGSGGKSEAEKAADQLNASYEQLKANLNETYELFGKNTEAAQVLYDTQNGELAKLSQARKDELVQLAERNDSQKVAQELADAASDRLKEETKAFEEHGKAVAAQIDDMQFELSIMGLSNIKREKAIALRYANVDAMSAEGQEIGGLIEKMDQAQKTAQLWQDVQGTIADSLFDLTTDIGNAGDIIGDFFDSIAKAITRSIAEDWAGKITDLLKGFGNGNSAAASGGATSGWGGFITYVIGAFGGAKAAGGDVFSGRPLLVGEQGPEMFVPRTAGTIMTASETAGIGTGSRIDNRNYFAFAAPTSPKTQTQIASRVGFELRRSQRLGT